MPELLADTLLVAQMHLLMIWRRLVLYLVVMMLFPLSMLFFARFILPSGVPAGSRLIAGSIVFSLGINTVNMLAQQISYQRFNYQLKLYVVSPIRQLSYAAGLVLFNVTQGMVNAFLILLFAPLFGIDIHLSLWLIPLTFLTAISLTGIALVIGTWAPSMETGNLLANTVGILVVMMSPIYFPLSRLPAALQWPARLSPYTHAGAAIDRVLSGSGGFAGEIGILAGITVVTLVIGVWGMRWREA